MGFVDLATSPGLILLDDFVKHKSYIDGYSPSQADVSVFNAIKTFPDPAQFPYTCRWFLHISSFTDEFSQLPGDSTKPYTAYGPDAAEANPPADEDDWVDLFDSDEEEDSEAVRIREERLAEYNKKTAGKAKTAKFIVTLDVKPWDDETNMAELEKNVLAIEKDGLVWGEAKLEPIGFGIKKLRINLVVEDETVSLDELREQIQEDEQNVQSTDIVTMQKL